jgi:hypothetical protein
MSKNSNKKRTSGAPKAVKARIQVLSKGFATVAAPTDVFDVNGAMTVATQVVTDLATELAPFDETDREHATYEKTLQARNAGTDATLARLDAIEAAVRAKLGATNPDLRLYGLIPKRAPKKRATPEQAESAEQASATRKEHDAALAEKPAAPTN